MKVKLRDYQKDIITKINAHFSNGEKEVVMAMCPGAGKTVVSLVMTKLNKEKTLVLAHGTNVILNQWNQRVKDYGMRKSKNLRIELPQSIYNKELEQIDTLIVDEAHEFYLAGSNNKTKGMVQKIIEKTKPKKILLLTGTPSKFIRRGYKVEIVAAEKLIEKGFLNNVYFGVASTNEKIKDSDYNKDDELKSSFKFKTVEKDLDGLLTAIVKRLKGNLTKSSPYLSKLTTKKWAPVFGQLHKTMIACHNIKQARTVYKYFKNKKINAVISESDGDPYSLGIQKFIDEEDVKVLIVVNRGVLGFDMEDLVNVIDLTGTRNIDRMYQLWARVVRKNKNHNTKYFFKISTEDEMQLTKFYATAALNMIRHDFISEFNGKNLEGKLPVIKRIISDETNKSNKKGDKGNKNKGKGTVQMVPIDALFEAQVESSKLLINILNNVDSKLNEYAYTTIDRIKQINYGKTSLIKAIKEENLLRMIKTSKDDERVYV